MAALPEYDSLLTEIRLTVEEAHPPVPKVTSSLQTASVPAPIQLLLAEAHISAQVIVPIYSLEVQAIPTLKIGYSVQHVSAFAQSTSKPRAGALLGPIDAGFHVGAQSIRFIPVTDAGGRTTTLPAETAFHLPVVRLSARLDGFPCHRVQVLTTVDSVSVKLTADIIDNILTVQDHFGKDVDELLGVIKAKRARQAETLEVQPSTDAEVAVVDKVKKELEPIAWDAQVALRGFKVGIKGPQATQWIEAELLEGHASSTALSSAQVLHWQASVQNLALSLAQHNPDSAAKGPTDRRYRLAFFRLDLSASNAVINLPELPAASVYGDDRTPHLHFRLPRVHAVIQPSAIEALGDLVDFYQEEIELRRKSRRQAVEALQERVVQTFDEMNDDDQNARSWLASCVVSLEMQSLGVAIPLNDDGIPAPESRLRRAKSAQSRPAFLVTIPSVKFATQKGSAGYARVTNFALQFVSDFDQGRKEDFDGATHQSLNRVLLPEMRCTVRSTSQGPMLVHSQVSGLEVDLEPTVVAFAFSLIDVYRLSHERFAKFAPQPSTAEPSAAQSPVTASPPRLPPPQTSGSTLQATFEFESGTIRLHCRSTAGDKRGPTHQRNTSRPHPHRRGQSLNDFGQLLAFSRSNESKAVPDIVRLPSLSVWSEYQEGLGSAFSRLHVDLVIHASNNTLYPTLLPFISDVANQIKERALPTPSASTSPTPPSAPEPISPYVPAQPMSFGRMRIGVSLKVDKSRLEISCLPAAEVTARLTWESGGFLVTISPEKRGIEFALTVDGVAAGLRHSFSPEDCLSAEAKGIAASVSFHGGDTTRGESSTLSAVVDLPDVSAETSFRHLQDWLCFKSVWLDRMDLGPAAAPAKAESKQLVDQPSPSFCDGSSSSPTAITTLIHVQLGKFRFLCDLGQAIGRSEFLVDTITARCRWVAGESRTFSINVKLLELLGQGRAGGSMVVDGLFFETVLQDQEDISTDLVSLSRLSQNHIRSCSCFH